MKPSSQERSPPRPPSPPSPLSTHGPTALP
jgi:hypothetical protein